MEKTEKELLKLFDYFRIESAKELNANDYLALINAALNVDDIEQKFTGLIQKLRNIRDDIKNHLQNN